MRVSLLDDSFSGSFFPNGNENVNYDELVNSSTASNDYSAHINELSSNNDSCPVVQTESSKNIEGDGGGATELMIINQSLSSSSRSSGDGGGDESRTSRNSSSPSVENSRQSIIIVGTLPKNYKGSYQYMSNPSLMRHKF